MIFVSNLTLKSGNAVLLDDVSFEVSQGGLFGIIGEEGEGKTALLRALAALIRPTSGEIRVAGFSSIHQPKQAQRATGYLAKDGGVYLDMTCAEYLNFFAGCYGIAPGARAGLVNDLLSLTDLQKRADTPIASLTRAMGQRLGIARILVHDPPVLLLDEPMRGMDPRAQVETRELLRELANMGKTIVLSARSLPEAEGLITRGALLSGGKIRAQGAFAQLAEVGVNTRTIVIRAAGNPQNVLELTRACAGAREAWSVDNATPTPAISSQPLTTEFRCRFDGSYADAETLLNTLLHHGIQVVAYHEI